MRFGSWGGSTGGVERLFGEGRAASGIKARAHHDDLYADEIMLVSDKREILIDGLCQKAREVWALVYKEARACDRAMRVDVGKAKKRLGSEKTLKGWLANRRKQVSALESRFPQTSMTSVQAANMIVDDGWGDTHKKEVIFQKKKRTTRFIEAVLEGTIPPEQARTILISFDNT